MITIFGAYNFPPPLKGLVRHHRLMWAAEEVGLPYRVRWMDLMKGEHREAPNRLINPFGKIPSLEDGPLKLFESGAIVNYIFEKAGRAPEDLETRTKLSQWCYAALTTIEPATIDVLRWEVFWRDRPEREARRAESLQVAQTRLAELDGALADKPYLLGSRFSPADILMATAIDFGNAAPELFSGSPRIASYMQRCKARPGYKQAEAAQEKAPKAAA